MAHEQLVEKRQPKSFEALTPELSQWILDFTKGMGFTRTTPVQAMAIPLLMGNKDLVVEAVTGSGKTLSFLIPLVERILKSEEPNKKGHVRSIVLAPTKELANQIYDVLRGLLDFHQPSAAFVKQYNSPLPDDSDNEEMEAPETLQIPAGPYLVPQLLIGGHTKVSEDLSTFSALSPNILIGTPRRMVEVLQSSRVQLRRHWFDLLVLDEADRLLDPNFQPDLQNILDMLPKERRTGLFSASVSEAVNELVRVGMRYPFKISAKVRGKSGALDKRTPESLRLYYIVTKPTLKLPLLKNIIRETHADKCIVYVSTRAGVDYWNHLLPSLLGVSVFPLHGDHKTAIRIKNLQRFRDCISSAILLTTDVLARGIDIPDIDLVIQLDPPTQPKDFIHRCGRSGRAGKRGAAITFLSAGSEEDYIQYLSLQGTTLEPYPASSLLPHADTAVEATNDIRSILKQKRELHDRSQKAFVSWVQAYTKTLPADIFSIKRIDWADVGRAWGLLRWPKMPELRRHFPQAREDRTFELSLPTGFDINDIVYADKIRESKRKAILDAISRGERPEMPGKHGGALAEARRRKENAWSGQKDMKATREARRGKKEARRKAESNANMTEAEKLKALELEQLIAKVKAKNLEEESFEGFAD